MKNLLKRISSSDNCPRKAESEKDVDFKTKNKICNHIYCFNFIKSF